jgi:hypothetical protein
MWQCILGSETEEHMTLYLFCCDNGAHHASALDEPLEIRQTESLCEDQRGDARGVQRGDHEVDRDLLVSEHACTSCASALKIATRLRNTIIL